MRIQYKHLVIRGKTVLEKSETRVGTYGELLTKQPTFQPILQSSSFLVGTIRK